jgi:hypothetical protein
MPKAWESRGFPGPHTAQYTYFYASSVEDIVMADGAEQPAGSLAVRKQVSSDGGASWVTTYSLVVAAPVLSLERIVFRNSKYHIHVSDDGTGTTGGAYESASLDGPWVKSGALAHDFPPFGFFSATQLAPTTAGKYFVQAQGPNPAPLAPHRVFRDTRASQVTFPAGFVESGSLFSPISGADPLITTTNGAGDNKLCRVTGLAAADVTPGFMPVGGQMHAFGSSQAGTIVGAVTDAGFESSFMRSTNGGSTWTQHTTTTGAQLLEIRHAGGLVWYAATMGQRLWKSINDGVTWAEDLDAPNTPWASAQGMIIPIGVEFL